MRTSGADIRSRKAPYARVTPESFPAPPAAGFVRMKKWWALQDLNLRPTVPAPIDLFRAGGDRVES